jgi:dihydrofolate reductase
MTDPVYIPLVIVAAVGRNGAIGQGNRLPWSMPSDLAHFRCCTMGRPMIMGRLTFEAIGRALPGRESIVVSRSADPGWPDGVWHAADPEAALTLGRDRATAMGADSVILAGGASLFRSMMPLTDRLQMTFVDLEPTADTFFPPIDPAVWREENRTTKTRSPRDDASCVFVEYLRRDHQE